MLFSAMHESIEWVSSVTLPLKWPTPRPLTYVPSSPYLVANETPALLSRSPSPATLLDPHDRCVATSDHARPIVEDTKPLVIKDE